MNCSFSFCSYYGNWNKMICCLHKTNSAVTHCISFRRRVWFRRQLLLSFAGVWTSLVYCIKVHQSTVLSISRQSSQVMGATFRSTSWATVSILILPRVFCIGQPVGDFQEPVCQEMTRWIERERVGHFLREAKLTFKLSFFKSHPLSKRPYHSFIYLCIYQNPGGWVGSFHPFHFIAHVK